jgi:hypothetical protein
MAIDHDTVKPKLPDASLKLIRRVFGRLERDSREATEFIGMTPNLGS